MRYFLSCTVVLLFSACAGTVEQLPVAAPPFSANEPPARIAPHTAHKTEAHKTGRPQGFSLLQELMEGNRRFVEGRITAKHRDQGRRLALVAGQEPKVIILSCSDSRVPPEIVFDQGLGDIFVVRSAGEVADAIGLASIEYAVEHLGARLIVVMGHDSCGAVKAALGTPPGKSAGSPHLDALIGAIRPHLPRLPGTPGDALQVSIRSQAEAVARELSERSQILQHAQSTEGLVIVRAIYHLDSGWVEFWL